MEFITFHCPNCQQPLKIPAEKAGRRAKCNKCGHPLTIPSESENLAIKETKPAPAARKPAEQEEDEGPAIYGVVAEPEPAEPPKPRKRDEDDDEDDEDRPAAKSKREKRIYEDLDEDDEEEEEEKKEEVVKRRRRSFKGLRKAPMFPEKWRRVRVGMMLLAVSICVGIAGLVVIRGVVLAGLLAKPGYAQVAVQVFPQRIQPVSSGPGQPPNLDLARFFVGLLMGSNNVDTARLLMLLGTSLLILQSVLAIVAYIFYLQVPPRFGTRGLATALTVLGVVNLILLVVFRLLPLTGALSYVLVPVYAMELPMLTANFVRLEPLHVLWMNLPMLEVFAGVLVMCLAAFEAILGAAFVRAVGTFLRDEDTANKGFGLLKLGTGTLFIFVSYQMASLAGTSAVLVGVLRVLYWLGTCFLLGFLAWYVTVLFQTRTMIDKKLRLPI
jgi:hypothetical protein